MDRNWNRSGGGGGGGSSGEKMYKQPYSSGGGGRNHNQPYSGSGGSNTQNNNYRKKNDFSGQEYYSKIVKPVVQPLKKESLQVALLEDELMDVNFSWIKNT
jgi:hypothetical protein